MELKITKVDPGKRKPAAPHDMQLGFGRYFTDHMFMVNYAPEQGWHDARIVPHQALSLDPAATVLHYAQQVFEGLKAYRGVDNGIRLFRARTNFARMKESAQRLCMPSFEIEEIVTALKQLILVDRDWIPRSEGCSLYIRPTMIATDPILGVRPSQTFLFYIILSPVGAYYPEGFNPISIMVQDEYVRAFVGGVGASKTGGNYAASLLGQVEAKAHGFTQVLWLDGREHRYVEEVGTMNMFFVIGDEVITSPLTGSILPGVTRDSVLQILRSWSDYRVSERMLAIDEVVKAQETGDLREAFGTGTAAVISPVGSFHYKGSTYRVGDGKTGALSQRLYDHIIALQYGRSPDPNGWVERIDL